MKHKAAFLLALFTVAFGGVGCRLVQTINGDRGKPVVSYAISPDGKQLVFSANDGDLYLLDLDSKKVSQITKTPAYEKRPSFSPDGRSIVYVSEPTGDKFSSRVFRMQIDTREITQLTSDPKICDNNPHYSRDGRRIVFARATRNSGNIYIVDLWNDYDLYVMNADGTGQKRVTNGLYERDLEARFSSDGSDLIFNGTNAPSNGTPGTSLILKIKADGTDNVPSVIMPATPRQSDEENRNIEYRSVDVSPDGNSIMFRSDYEVRLFDMTTKSLTDLEVKRPEGTTARLFDPVFSTDGKRAIVFMTVFGGDSEHDTSLWSVDIDGKGQKEIVDEAIFAHPLEWKPKN